jgi:hypothetical protein
MIVLPFTVAGALHSLLPCGILGKEATRNG